MATMRERVPLPTEEEMQASQRGGLEITGISAVNRGRLLFLNIALRSGGIETVHLDPIGADNLVRLLRKFLPNEGQSQSSPVRWAVEDLLTFA